MIVHLRPGSKLSPQSINAIANLVASAVEGLMPESITIVDSRGALLTRPRKAAADEGSQPSEASLEYRQKIESALLAKINATLEPLLGADKFRAGISVDCDFTSGEQSEETVDPNKSVMLTSQKTEETSGSASSAGAPGTAANLPRPPKPSTSGSNGINRKTENIAFQTSRMVRHTRMPQGTVKRISISLLIDHELKWEGPPQKQKRVLIAPTPERLKSIHDLVSGIAGLSADRGDQLVVEALPFEATLSAEPPSPIAVSPAPDPRFPKWMIPLISDPKNMIIACIAAGALPVLVIILMLVFRKKAKVSAEAPHAIAASATSSQPSIDGKDPAETPALEEETPFQFKLPKETTKKSEFLIRHIRENIQKDNTSMVNVLRTWLADNSASENME